MSERQTVERVDAGFELEGRFYRWSLSDTGKDLMLIDRFTGMPVDQFFEVVDDETERGRAPIILAMIATSVRAANPDWSVERIVRLIMATSLTDVAFINEDSEEQQVPPVEAGEEPATSEAQPESQPESSPSSTPAGSSNSETLYAIPA